MSKIVFPLLKVITQKAKASFQQKTQILEEVQEKFLFQLIRDHQNTELGQKFGLPSIKTVEQFRQKVPILPYSEYVPYTDQIAQGSQNVLNPDKVVYISLTSGSTGNQKKIPVTRQYQRSLTKPNLASMGFLFEALAQRDPQDNYKVLLTNSIVRQGKTSGGINYGPVTVESIRSGQLLYRQILANPYRSLEVAESISRHYVCLLFALNNPVTNLMVTNFPMLMLRTCGYLEKYAEDFIQDLETGAIASWLEIDPKLRTQLEKQWSANPQRAAELKTILKKQGRLTPKLVWPKLSCVITALGGTSDFYVERFPQYFGDTPIFGGVYGTGEGTFGVGYELNNEGSILSIESGFYEFIPQDQWEEENPKTLLPSQVQVGHYYRLLVTTYSGFYRYDIGDVVEVLGFYEKTPIIVFRHRRGGLLSSTTEKTTEFHVTQAMQKLTQELNVTLDDFCITLSDHEFPARYLVNIELVGEPKLKKPQEFLQRFEYWLTEFNNPYGTVRSSEVPDPKLRILAPGSFAKIRQKQREKGADDATIKVLHISEDRHFLEGLQILEEFSL